MVFFSCDGCSESLKKNQVDAHARRCRECVSVSCIDCSVSFWGDDYRKHTSCISEAERYEKTVYKGPRKNDTSNRKQTPQEAWMSVITESLDNCPPDLKPHIETIISYENVPRKEKAFRNYASNSLKLYGRNGETIIASLWKHFSGIRTKRAEEKEAAVAAKKALDEEKKMETSSSVDNDDTKSSKDKKEVESESSSNVTTDVKESNNDSSILKIKKKDSKKVKKVVKKALKKAPKHRLKLKELKIIVKKEVTLESNNAKEDVDWKEIIKDAVLNSKDSMRLEGKKVILVDVD